MRSIRHRLLLSMMVTGLVPVVAVLVPLLTVLHKDVLRSESEKIADTSRQLSRHVAEVMDRSARDLETLTSNPIFSDTAGNTEGKIAELRRLVGIHEGFSDLSLYDSAGFLVGSTAEDIPVYREYSDWFQKAMKGEISVSQPHRTLGHEGLYLTVFLPVRSGDNPVIEVIKARLSFDRVMGLLKDKRVGDLGRVVLLDAWGNVLCGTDNEGLLTKFDPRKNSAAWMVTNQGTYTDPSGVNHLFAAEVLPKNLTHVDSHWIVLAMKPMAEVDKMMSRAKNMLALATLIMVSVAIGLGWLTSRHVSRPLERLGAVAQQIAGGDIAARAQPAGVIEIDHLAHSFNQMAKEVAENREGLERLVVSRTDSLRRSQMELESTSAQLRAAFTSTNNGFLVEDLSGKVVLVNDLFLSLVTSTTREFTASQDASEIVRILETGWVATGTGNNWRSMAERGEIIDVELISSNDSGERTLHVYSAPISDHRNRPIGRVWAVQDLTEQRHLESSLRQSQKMEAVGQLAGGVAHDFNNLLTGILGHIALVEQDLGKSADPACREHLRHAMRAGERAADLVKQLLGFSRRSRMDLKPCDANEVLDEVRHILSSTIDPRIRLIAELEPQPWRVMADLNLLSQVIMNMAVNAKDAMSSGGHLTFRSANRLIRESELREGSDHRAGEHLVITIEDDGEGIPYDVQKRIFEPFFTTKAPGKGTGLGLATCFGIVKQLGGWIELDSHPGKGTRFRIFLPRSAAAEAQPDHPDAPVLTSGQMEEKPAPSGTILIVDDEDVVRRVAASLLKKLGYQVIEARDGLEGLETFGARGDEIDLVLLDLTMPNLSGKETFRFLRERHGSVPVLICSGYLVDVTEFAEECGSCPDAFVQKPYRVEDLAAAVAGALEVKRRAA